MKDLFNDLINEVLSGRIQINGCYYNIGFNTNIVHDGKINSFRSEDNSSYLFPTLQINDYATFLYYLCDYVDKAKDFYSDELNTKYGDFSDNDVSKLLMAFIWANATSYDFNNPIQYLQRRINFLDDRAMEGISNRRTTDGIDAFDNSIIEYSIEKAPLNLEAPYMLTTRLKNGDDIYNLPSIFFGLNDDECHIYSVQNKKMGVDLTSYHKKMRRKIQKVKKGFSGDDLDATDSSDVELFNVNHPENITSVDPSFLIALTVGLSVFNNMGVSSIVVPDFFPVRFNSKQIVTSIKANSKSDDEKELFLHFEEIINDKINRNIVDKKLRTFRRLSYHFEFLDIDAFPKELDDSMHISIHDSYCCNNEVLNDVYTKVYNSTNEINKHRR